MYKLESQNYIDQWKNSTINCFLIFPSETEYIAKYTKFKILI